MSSWRKVNILVDTRVSRLSRLLTDENGSVLGVESKTVNDDSHIRLLVPMLCLRLVALHRIAVKTPSWISSAPI